MTPGAALLWKLGAGGASVIALALLGALILEKQATTRAENERDSLQARIEDPDFGYIARLTTCGDNTARLQASLDRQSEQIQVLSEEGQARRTETERRLEELRAEAEAAQSALDRRLQAPLLGTTSYERVQEIHGRFLEALGE